jgi:hypothetical protein
VGAILVFAAAVAGIVAGSGESGDSGAGGGSPSDLPTPRSAPEGSAAEQPNAATRPAPKPAPGAAAVEKAIWGPVRMPGGAAAMPVYDRLGVDVLQLQVRWADVAAERPSNPLSPDVPAYAWPPDVGRAIDEAADHGISVALMVTTAPAWANGGGPEILAPADSADFADFLIAASRRYPQVRRWMIWWEPNRGDRFQPNARDDPRGPRAYAVLLENAYEALKVADAKNVVIGGMTYTGGDVRPPDFLRWMRLPGGEPPRLDLYGHNPYPYRRPDLAQRPETGGWRDLSDLDDLRSEVARTYRPLGMRPRLWLSEFTVQSDTDSRYFPYHVSEAEQADWLRRGYATAAEAGGVAALGWYELLDQPAAVGNANWGLMTSDGKPKPAFGAYRAAG